MLNPYVCLIIAIVLAIIAAFAHFYPFAPDQYPWRRGFFYASWVFYLLYVYAIFHKS
jgi:uncharacterized membrane protein YecN with MAPEG domain